MFNGYAGSGLETTFTPAPAGESATIMALLIDTDRARDGPRICLPVPASSTGRHHHRTQPATPANRMNTPGGPRGHQRAVLMATSGRKPVGP
jgi:hypothetical protein